MERAHQYELTCLKVNKGQVEEEEEAPDKPARTEAELAPLPPLRGDEGGEVASEV